MHYVLDYEICALLFLAVITVRFFSTRHFPSRANKLFAATLICAFVDILLDIFSSLLIERAALCPYWLLSAVNIIFYSIQTLFPLLMTTYILIITGHFQKNGVAYKLLASPAAAFIALLTVNPLSELFFYLSAGGVYTRGPLFYYLYFGCMFYFAAAFVVVILYRKDLTRAQFRSLVSILLIVAASVILQYLFPEYLLTGVAIALAITVMIFTLQDPDDMADITTGAFLYGATLTFLRDRLTLKRSFPVIAVDISGIARLNELFGFDVGNAAAGAVGSFLISKDGGSWVFRISDTRFLIITDDREKHDSLLWRITSRFRQPWHVGSTIVMLSAVIRHLPSSEGFETPEDVLGVINTALSDADGVGETTCEEIDGDTLAEIRRRTRLEATLRRSIATGEGMSVYYQPIYSIGKNKFTGAEALLRFHDETIGQVPPSEFISVAEKAGLVLQVDQLVMRRVCEFIRRHDIKDELGLECIELNLSPADFYYANLVESLSSIADESGVNPSLLAFEITETVTSSEDLAEHMDELRERGFRFALDDFGSGYSNIARVVELPLAIVKLDRSLLTIRDAEDFTRNVVFEDVVRMFRRIGVQSVVEGVETVRQAQLAKRLNADFVQGYYYARPMPEAEFVDFLTRNNSK